MIKSISIENFRCFHQTQIEGFGQVNLIGGQNNAGKTTLLEAIYLANNPHSKSVIFIQQKLRGEATDVDHPERTWSSLFHKFEKDQEIKLSVETASANFGGRFVCKESYEKQLDGAKEDDLVKIEDDSNLDGKVSQSSLISYYHHSLHQKGPAPAMRMDANQGSRNFVIGGGLPVPSFYPSFIPAGFRPTPWSVADNIESLRYNGQNQAVLEVLHMLQVIDPSIEHLEVFNFGDKRVHLKRKGEAFMPINLFGDAMNKVAQIILRIVGSPNSILLIDEIENGVHYTHHRDLWKFVFRLATQFGVQIFAASHSYEMIRAFNQMASAENLGPSAMYFEMYRSLRSGEIVGKGFAPDLLAYAIANNQSFRGE